MNKELNMNIVEKALNKEEMETLNALFQKIEDYKESLVLKPGDKLKRKRDGKVVTYHSKANMGAAYIWVDEIEIPVYEYDYEKIIK